MKKWCITLDELRGNTSEHLLQRFLLDNIINTTADVNITKNAQTSFVYFILYIRYSSTRATINKYCVYK